MIRHVVMFTFKAGTTEEQVGELAGTEEPHRHLDEAAPVRLRV